MATALINDDEASMEFPDPNPVIEDASKEEKLRYILDVKMFSSMMLRATKFILTSDKETRMDFTINFRPESIDAMDDESLQSWVSLLRDRSVLVQKGRDISRKRALKEFLAIDDFKPLDPGSEKPR